MTGLTEKEWTGNTVLEYLVCLVLNLKELERFTVTPDPLLLSSMKKCLTPWVPGAKVRKPQAFLTWTYT